jgi:hypothetical protein
MSGRARILCGLIRCHLLPYIRWAPDGARTRRFGYGSPFLSPYTRPRPARSQEKTPESLDVHVALHVQHKPFGAFYD